MVVGPQKKLFLNLFVLNLIFLKALIQINNDQDGKSHSQFSLLYGDNVSDMSMLVITCA